jgi:acetyltransferase
MDLDASIRKVAALTAPRNIVVVGASARPGSWPAVVWETVNNFGFPGAIYPINPNRSSIGNVRCYPDFESLPEKPDHLVMLVPSALVPETLLSGARAGARSATVFSSGFGETGTAEGLELDRRLAQVIEQTGIAISGPNCTGNIVAKSRLVTLVDHRKLHIQAGSVALVGQSGGVLLYANHVLADRGIPIGYLITSGNEIGLTCADYIAFFAREPTVKVVFCYIDSIKDPERFKQACASARWAGKPVVVFKVGASEAGRHAALTHTGALAGSTEVFDAVLGDLGVIRVSSLDEAIETIELVVHAGVPIGRRIGALTLSGAYRAILLDGASGTGLIFPPLAAATEARLGQILGVGSMAGNPADGGFTVLTSVEAYLASIEAFCDDPNVDVLLLQAELPRETGMAASWEERFKRINELVGRRNKKAVCVSMFSRMLTDYSRAVRAELGNIAFVQETNKSMRALSYLAHWSELARRTQRSEPAANSTTRILAQPGPAAVRVRELAARARSDETVALSEPEAKEILRAYGIGTTREEVTTSPTEAVRAAERIGYPVVLKAVSSKLLHKSDLGAVMLNITNADELLRAYEQIHRNLKQGGFTAPADGMLVCQQVNGGTELVLGVLRDPEMGLVVMAGSGGVLLELVKDVAFAAVPVSQERALEMLERTRIARLLRGYRGARAHDMQAIAAAIVALARIATELEDVIESIDINPYVSLPGEAKGMALDALVVLKRASQ